MTNFDRDAALAKWTREVEGTGIAVTSLMRSAYRDGWDDARATSTSANVAQGDNAALIHAFDSALSGVPRYVIDRFGVEHVADGGGWIKESDLFDRFAASTPANVAQGADAVAYGEFNKARERFLSGEPVAMSDSTRELARQVLEQQASDTRSDEEKILAAVNFICDTRLDDPPAQTALTDDARDAKRYRFLRAGFGDMGPEVDMHNAFVDGGEVMDRTIDAALTAAQSGEPK